MLTQAITKILMSITVLLIANKEGACYNSASTMLPEKIYVPI